MNGGQTIVCLSGAGVAPELMGEATRVIAEVARLHAVALEAVHVPFGADAFTRYGHPLPLATRERYRRADAILAAEPREPAFEGVKADVDPAWHAALVHVRPLGDLVVIGPVAPGLDATAVRRAFDAAAARRGRVTSVGTSAGWRELVDAEADRLGVMDVEHSTIGQLLVTLRDAPQRLDIVVAEAELAAPVVDAASHLSAAVSTTAWGWLSEDGPGVFAPASTDSDEVAGFGVANPAGVLLAVALLLDEGLAQRAAGRTVRRAVQQVLRLNGSAPNGTRAFANAVIERLPEARTDTELFEEVWS